MSVHSNDRITWTAKLERLSKRAEEEKATVFNNLGHLLDKTLLETLYHQVWERLLMVGGLDLSGAECGNSARSFLRGLYRSGPVVLLPFLTPWFNKSLVEVVC